LVEMIEAPMIGLEVDGQFGGRFCMISAWTSSRTAVSASSGV
jgi:hypothetical protein